MKYALTYGSLGGFVIIASMLAGILVPARDSFF